MKKALLHILLHVLCLHFLRIHHDYFFQRVLESVRAEFLSGNISRLLVMYLLNYRSSKSTFSMLKMQLDVFLSSFYQVNSFVSCDVKLQEHPSFCSCSAFWYVIFYKNLIVLHHNVNNFLFYFDICIKFTLSLIISTIKKWQNLTWCIPFYDKNMLERKKNIRS